MAFGSQGIRFAKAFIELGLDATESQRQLRAFRNQMRSLRRISFGVGGALTAAFTPVVAIMSKAIKEATRFNEQASKLEVVFGRLAPNARAFIKTMEDGLGQSRQVMSIMVSGFQGIFQQMTSTADEAFMLSKHMTQLAVDMASFHDRDTEAVFIDLQAALAGSSEVMKKYNTIVNEAAVKQELLNNAIDPKDATEYQKVIARIHLITRAQANAAGDAARTADSLANQWRRFQNQIQNLFIDMGQELLPAVNDAMRDIVQTTKEWTPVLKQAANWAGVISEQLPGTGGAFADFKPSASRQETELASLERAIALREAYGPFASRLISVGGMGLAASSLTGGFGKGFSSSLDEMKARRRQIEDQRQRDREFLENLRNKRRKPKAAGPSGPDLPELTGGTPAATKSNAEAIQEFMASIPGDNIAPLGLSRYDSFGKIVNDLNRQAAAAKTAVDATQTMGRFTTSGFAGDFVASGSAGPVAIQRDQLKVQRDTLEWMKANAVVFQ